MRLALLIASMLAVAFGARLALGVIHWSERRELEVQGWMTVGFVAHAWEVERDRLTAALGVAPEPGERLRLADIAEAGGRPLDEVTATVERVLAEPVGR